MAASTMLQEMTATTMTADGSCRACHSSELEHGCRQLYIHTRTPQIGRLAFVFCCRASGTFPPSSMSAETVSHSNGKYIPPEIGINIGRHVSWRSDIGPVDGKLPPRGCTSYSTPVGGCGRWSVVSGQWSVVSGQWSVVSGPCIGRYKLSASALSITVSALHSGSSFIGLRSDPWSNRGSV